MHSFPLRSPLVLSLVDCTLDVLERLERIVDVGSGFKADTYGSILPACGHRKYRYLDHALCFDMPLLRPTLTLPSHRRLPPSLHMLLALASPWHLTSGIIVIRLSP